MLAELQLDASVSEYAGELLHVPKHTPYGNVCPQAVKFIPGIQSAVRFYCKCKQFIHVFSLVWN